MFGCGCGSERRWCGRERREGDGREETRRRIEFERTRLSRFGGDREAPSTSCSSHPYPSSPPSCFPKRSLQHHPPKRATKKQNDRVELTIFSSAQAFILFSAFRHFSNICSQPIATRNQAAQNQQLNELERNEKERNGTRKARRGNETNLIPSIQTLPVSSKDLTAVVSHLIDAVSALPTNQRAERQTDRQREGREEVSFVVSTPPSSASPSSLPFSLLSFFHSQIRPTPRHPPSLLQTMSRILRFSSAEHEVLCQNERLKEGR